MNVIVREQEITGYAFDVKAYVENLIIEKIKDGDNKLDAVLLNLLTELNNNYSKTNELIRIYFGCTLSNPEQEYEIEDLG